MSFVFLCRPIFDAPPVALTALVGQDEQLYWLARDFRHLLRRHACRSDLCTRDVLGTRSEFAGHYNRQTVVTHTTLLERLRSTRCALASRHERCHRLADLLADPTLAVRSVRDRPAHVLVQPSVVEAVQEEAADSHHQPFTVWLEFFKQRVFRELYRQPLYSVAPFEDVPDLLLDADALCASLVPAVENHGHPPTLTACVSSSSHPHQQQHAQFQPAPSVEGRADRRPQQ